MSEALFETQGKLTEVKLAVPFVLGADAPEASILASR